MSSSDDFINRDQRGDARNLAYQGSVRAGQTRVVYDPITGLSRAGEPTDIGENATPAEGLPDTNDRRSSSLSTDREALVLPCRPSPPTLNERCRHPVADREESFLTEQLREFRGRLHGKIVHV